jgi:carboxyl-terminal processing protease
MNFNRQTLLFIILLTIYYSLIQAPINNVTYSKFDETVFDWSRTWAHVMRIVRDKHYQINNPQEGMTKAINEFLNHLDPHSAFLDEKTYTRIKETTSGSFDGIGIIIDNTRKPKDRFLAVVETIIDGPSDKAGLEAGDKIIEIEEETLEDMTTEEIILKLKGKRGTKVNIKVLRDGQQDLLEFEITRDKIEEQNLLSFLIKNHNIYYLSLSTFSRKAIESMKQLIEQSQKNSYKGIIIDLRNNSGGLLSSVIDICGLFTPKDSLIVFTKDKNNKVLERYHTRQEPIVNSNIPIFILINNYTASAAEILAGCLQIYSQELAKKHPQKNKLMVFLAGTQTFGKGSVQEVIPIGNNSAIKLTTYLYFLSNDITVQGIGVTPDFYIDRTFAPPKQMEWMIKSYGREKRLPNSIQVNKDDQEKTKSKKKNAPQTKQQKWKERARKILKTDNQVRETISLINILNYANNHIPKLVSNREKALKYLKANHVNHDELEIEDITS